MKFDFIGPFVTSTVGVLRNVLQCDIGQGDVTLLRGNELDGDVSVVIGLQDRAGESVILNMNPETARSVCTAMNGVACNFTDAVGADTLGELANMIAGNAVSALGELGLSFSVQPPQSVNRGDLARLTEGLELFQVLMISPHGNISVNFTIRTA